jgi:hypothetical protein
MAATNVQSFSGDIEVASNINASSITATQKLTVNGPLQLTDGTSNIVDISVLGSATWTQQQKLEASVNQDHLGSAVAISKDGNTAIVTNVHPFRTDLRSGEAYIFTRSGSGLNPWSEQQRIQGLDTGVLDIFGCSVAISGDGNTVIVGAQGNSNGDRTFGAAYIFTRSNSTWTQQQKIQASDLSHYSYNYFGNSVAISEDGYTAIVGAQYYSVPPGGNANSSHGAAYIFTRAESGLNPWSEQQKISSPYPTWGGNFGNAVAISEDGDTVIVGYRKEASFATQCGAAYIFTRSNSTWTQQQKLEASDRAAYQYFGQSVAISGDTVIVGATYVDTFTGASYIFTRSNSTWTQQQKIQASDKADHMQFGYAVAISGDRVIVGSPTSYFPNPIYPDQTIDGVNFARGAAYIFNRAGTSWIEQPKPQSLDGAYGDYFGNSVAIPSDQLNERPTFIVGACHTYGVRNSYGAYLFQTSPSRTVFEGDIIANGTTLSFTGQHLCFPEGPIERGLVVSANRNKFMNLNGPLSTGLSAIKSSESLPIVSLSNVRNDTNIFGVVDSVESTSLMRTQRVGGTIVENKKESGDNRVIVNSLGEGAMWVVNTNGNISSGDYITTSNINGYGHKQDDDILHSYTVAKITMDCDFNPQELPIQVIKKDNNGTNVLDNYGRLQWKDTDNTQKAYKIKYLKVDGKETDQANAVCTAAYVGCTYHCG